MLSILPQGLENSLPKHIELWGLLETVCPPRVPVPSFFSGALSVAQSNSLFYETGPEGAKEGEEPF